MTKPTDRAVLRAEALRLVQEMERLSSRPIEVPWALNCGCAPFIARLRAELRAEALKLVEEMEKLASKATPGEWESSVASEGDGIFRCCVSRICGNREELLKAEGDEEHDEYDTQFIARCRTAVPELCRLLRAALEE